LGKPGTDPRAFTIAAAIGSRSSHRFTDGGREIFFGGGAPAIRLGMNPAGFGEDVFHIPLSWRPGQERAAIFLGGTD
jgi:hypothetical protein